MIHGLTDQPATLPCRRKISIGDNLGTRGAPRKLDHFRLVEGDPIPPDAVLRYRDPDARRSPFALACNLAPLENEQIFSTAMRSYGAAKLMCHGDGVTATRRGHSGRFRPVDGGCSECPHNPNNNDPGWRPPKGDPVCKANGRLYVILKGEGATYATRITTGSKWSIINLSSFVKRFSGLGPDLYTIPVELRVTMERVSVPGRARTPLPILSLHTTETVPELMARVDSHAAGRMLPGSAQPLMLPGPGVSDASVDAEPTDPLLYHGAIDVEAVPQDDYLAQLEDAAVRAKADIGGRFIAAGDAAKWLKARTPEQVKTALENAIMQAGAPLPGDEAQFDE